MCGIGGYLTFGAPPEQATLQAMADRMIHRGPDADGFFLDENLGFAFRRLGIIDLAGGDQPLYNEDRSLVLICNGEIYNYKELRRELIDRGHRLYTDCDTEVLVHLYEDYGPACVEKLNGQFAFAIWDRPRERLFLARDHLGICPLYIAETTDGAFVFGSEIKVVLEHPGVERRVDLTGLDQVFTFPGLVSPRTLFDNVRRVENGHYLLADRSGVVDREYWDLDYPRLEETVAQRSEGEHIEAMTEQFLRSVQYRLQADVPVGFYLSGGLDSSLIAAAIHRLAPDHRRHAFSVCFADNDADERQYQQIMARRVECYLHESRFDWQRTSDLMERMVYHAECPVKETYNTCSIRLSEMAREHGVKVILTGEGADELFAGYVGYRFDQMRQPSQGGGFEEALEEDLRRRLWGNPHLFYEHDYNALAETKQTLYSPEVRARFREFDCLRGPVVNKDRLVGRHPIHQRSYLDYKLRMADHLLMDHGDQMALANSVEARYPFLDVNLVEFARTLPPDLKLHDFQEKYILRKMGEDMLPDAILQREKFGWYAPGSPELLQAGVEWIQDALSHDRIRRQGYFDPDVIERLKTKYAAPGFRLNQPFESDLLVVVASFGILLDTFDLPGAARVETALPAPRTAALSQEN